MKNESPYYEEVSLNLADEFWRESPRIAPNAGPAAGRETSMIWNWMARRIHIGAACMTSARIKVRLLPGRDGRGIVGHTRT